MHDCIHFTGKPPTIAVRLLSAFALIFLLFSGSAIAENDWQSLASIEASVENFIREKTAGQPGSYAISVTHIDPRIKLAKCDSVETFLPSGNKLWGRSSIGVRCTAPTPWALYVPVLIRVSSTVLVSARVISSGQTLQTEDLVLQKKDITAFAGSVLTSPDQAIGKSVVTGISAGVVIRSEMLRTPMAILQGQQVMLVAQGAGFKISSEGQAMGNAAAGQVVAVKTRSGQIIKGIARTGGMVEVSF